MDYSSLTIEDCIRKQEQEGMAAVIENGTITGFIEEKSPYQSGNSDRGSNQEHTI